MEIVIRGYLYFVIFYEIILMLFTLKTAVYFETDHNFIPANLTLIGIVPIYHISMAWTLIELLLMNGELFCEIMTADLEKEDLKE